MSTPQQEKLLRIAKLLDSEGLSIIDEIEAVEAKIEAIQAVIDQVKKMEGPKGEKGDSLPGERGSKFIGRFNSVEDLPDDVKDGDFAYVVTRGELWYAREYGTEQFNSTGV